MKRVDGRQTEIKQVRYGETYSRYKARRGYGRRDLQEGKLVGARGS
tara:strand:+ start:353 stop:490 length:138 start_codon:yes stop_codon:yes gene_type:complete